MRIAPNENKLVGQTGACQMGFNLEKNVHFTFSALQFDKANIQL